MLLASASLFILGRVVCFLERRIWPPVFGCLPGIAVYREVCSGTWALNRTCACFSDKETSPPAIWEKLIFQTVADGSRARRDWQPPLGGCESGDRRGQTEELREEAGRLPPRPGQGSPSLPRAGKQRTSRLSVFLTSVVLHQPLIKDTHPPAKWVNERLADDSEVYLFESLFFCSHATAFRTRRKSSESAPCRYKSARCTCCDVLNPSESVGRASWLQFPHQWSLQWCPPRASRLAVLGCAAAWILHIAPRVLLDLIFIYVFKKAEPVHPSSCV